MPMPFRRGARRVLDPIVEFLRIEAVGGAVLLAATITALALANSPLADTYQRLWQQPLTVGGLRWDLRHWVNDALMTIFFLVIGLEVKRELTIGRLRDPRRATLPIVAALAGALVPALVFLAVNPSGPAARGWAIPMATDPAFAVGVLALLGSRVPVGAKAFLLALAVVDDIAAVTVIAIAYTSQLALGWLALAAVGVLAGALLLRAPVLPLWAWGLLGLLGVRVACHHRRGRPRLRRPGPPDRRPLPAGAAGGPAASGLGLSGGAAVRPGQCRRRRGRRAALGGLG
jgi:NhaA family Na+:H+ antiporter